MLEYQPQKLSLALGRLRRAPEAALEAVARVLETQSEETVLAKDQSPWGERWAPLKNSSRGAGARPLKNSGNLLKIRAETSAPKSLVRLGTEAPYGVFHQFGTKRGLPARPFLPLRPDGRTDLPAAWSDSALAAAQTALAKNSGGLA